MNIPSDLVRRGLVGGYRCPISGREFVSDDGLKETKQQLYREQQEFTAALIHDMGGGDIDTLKARYADYVAKQAEEQQ